MTFAYICRQSHSVTVNLVRGILEPSCSRALSRHVRGVYMPMMKQSDAEEARAKGERQEEAQARITTTLYELIAALQDAAGPDADALVVATVVDLLHSGQLTFLGKASMYSC
jgi:hypothetical protein